MVALVAACLAEQASAGTGTLTTFAPSGPSAAGFSGGASGFGSVAGS